MKTTPTATYRLQFRNGLGFDEAARAVPYLARLGVSHLYASPLFTAVSGSTHGYDVTDCNAIDPVLGGREGFERLSAELKRHGLGLLLDIVPNHMAASLENAWWLSVVRWGSQSPRAGHFDIDWRRRLTLPFLGETFADALKEGEIVLGIDGYGWPCLRYFETLYPLHPQTWREALTDAPGRYAEELRRIADLGPDLAEAALAEAFARGGAGDLEAEFSRNPAAREKIASLHDRQPWELTYWKEARRDLSYRRFFEVTGLVGLRVEDRPVFDDVHRLALELLRDGFVDGLRIDHVDGLADPGAYLDRLREAAGPDAWIVVEKILEHGETLPSAWPVDGTTGYEFIDAMADLLCHGSGLRRLRRGYGEDTSSPPVEALREEAKAQVVAVNFEGELERLAAAASRLAGFPSAAMSRALAALLVAMPVYRTYAPSGDGEMGGADREVLETARAHAQAAAPDDAEAIAFLCSALAGDHASAGTADAVSLRTGFQQLSGPVMAKGVEDTLFYRDATLLALDEVGASPERPWPMIDRFHRTMSQRARAAKLTLNATATHDTKRGEDARARLFALTGSPEEWLAVVADMRHAMARHVRALPAGPAPEPHVEHLLWQSLLGALRGAGDLGERMTAFAEKAVREAKLRSDWLDPDPQYEAAIAGYVEAMTDRETVASFEKRIRRFVEAGWTNSLVQVFVKLLAPGIPDIYQGVERGDFSLVDPDNRRSVDFAGLSDVLPVQEPDVADAAAFKHWLIASLLRERRKARDLFAVGEYLPLRVEAGGGCHFAFARLLGDRAAIAMARLFPLSADEGGATLPLPGELAARSWRNSLSGQSLDPSAPLELSAILRHRPVALLVAD